MYSDYDKEVIETAMRFWTVQKKRKIILMHWQKRKIGRKENFRAAVMT